MNAVVCGDCLEVMRGWPDDCVDLVFGSPPYEDARTYSMGFKLKGQAWVDWMVQVVKESSRVCRGLVAFVVNGRTRNYRWSATPALLAADLHRAGFHLRKPPIFGRRGGIPGGGGRDWLRDDYEFVVCVASPGRLPWSDNTACGHPPKHRPGGRPSHRTRSGVRVAGRAYVPPALANPGNLMIGPVGKWHMGSDLAHENEAPFPEWLAERFVRPFCLFGGIVLDPFCGSGTTLAVAKRFGREFIGIDIRQDQVDLSLRRTESITPEHGGQGWPQRNLSEASAVSATDSPAMPSLAS